MSNNNNNLPSRIQKSVKQNRWMPVWGVHPTFHRSSKCFGPVHEVAEELNIIRQTVQRIVKRDLHLSAFKLRSPQNLLKETFACCLTNRKTTFGLTSKSTLLKKVKWWFAKHVMISPAGRKGKTALNSIQGYSKIMLTLKRRHCHPDLLKSASLFRPCCFLFQQDGGPSRLLTRQSWLMR